MTDPGLRNRSAVVAGVVVGIVHLVASFAAFAAADAVPQARQQWAMITNDVLSIPIRTLDGILTHGVGAAFQIGGVRVDFFLWEFPLNALLWGIVTWMVWSRISQSQHPPAKATP